MKKLILFDIDQTLLKNTVGSKETFSYAFREVFDIETSIDIIVSNGMTNQQIIIEVLKKHNLCEEEIIPKIPDMIKLMVDCYKNMEKKGKPIILKGVTDLLEELEKKNYILGLVTGNLQPIALSTMKSIGLDKYFKLGGFGDDDISRTKLVKLAIDRAKNGYNFKFNNNVVLFGDSPNDIKAGKESKVFTIGVATGIFSKENLKNTGADAVFDSLENTDEIMSVILG